MATRATPLVSVVIPSHNYAEFLGDALESARAQGYAPVELIVVDDGSTDDTPAVLRSVGGRSQVVRLDGRGVSAARNAGLARASGEFVVFLDADDLLIPGGLAAQIERALRDDRPEAVIGAWYVCDVRRGAAALVRSPLRPGEVLPQILQGNVVTTPSAVLLRRRAVETAGGFDSQFSFAADWEMWIRLVRSGGRVVAIDPAVAVYRMHERSMTRHLEGAVREVVSVLDRVFTDPSLPATARAVEPQARSAMAQYLSRLAIEQGDLDGAGRLLRQALTADPRAADALEFYHGLARALGRRKRFDEGRDVAAAIEALDGLAEHLDPDPAPNRRALRRLAAGMLARSAGVWGVAVRSLGAALMASWRTVLAPPQAAQAARLLLPLRVTAAVRAALERAGLRRDPARAWPPVVTALVQPYGHRGP